jgi:hypothetical protein
MVVRLYYAFYSSYLAKEDEIHSMRCYIQRTLQSLSRKVADPAVGSLAGAPEARFHKFPAAQTP